MSSHGDDVAFWRRVEVMSVRDCWHWQGTMQDAYGAFHVSSSGEQVRAHRYAWAFAYGPIPTGMSVLHGCDNARCVNPRHLRIGTHEDNNADKRVVSRVTALLQQAEIDEAEQARLQKLAATPAAEAPKLPASFAATIKRLRKQLGLKQGEFGAILGVSQVTVCKWEKGASGATLARLSSIAKALNVDFAELIA